MDYVVGNLAQISENKEYYFRKTPIVIFLFIYTVLISCTGLIIFAKNYKINNYTTLEGNIAINQEVTIGNNKTIKNKNDFEQVYSAQVVVPNSILKKIEHSKKVKCSFVDANGRKRNVYGVVSHYNGDNKGYLVAVISIYKYELANNKIYYIKPETKCNFKFQLEKEILFDYIWKKVA